MVKGELNAGCVNSLRWRWFGGVKWPGRIAIPYIDGLLLQGVLMLMLIKGADAIGNVLPWKHPKGSDIFHQCEGQTASWP